MLSEQQCQKTGGWSRAGSSHERSRPSRTAHPPDNPAHAAAKSVGRNKHRCTAPRCGHRSCPILHHCCHAGVFAPLGITGREAPGFRVAPDFLESAPGQHIVLLLEPGASPFLLLPKNIYIRAHYSPPVDSARREVRGSEEIKEHGGGERDRFRAEGGRNIAGNLCSIGGVTSRCTRGGSAWKEKRPTAGGTAKARFLMALQDGKSYRRRIPEHRGESSSSEG